MPDLKNLAGAYEGRCRIREGMESSLSAAEKKQFKRDASPVSLILAEDGAFSYKGTTEGRCELRENRVVCIPVSVAGTTREAMERAAAEEDRVFGLAWLFTPFELRIEGNSLLMGEERSVVYTEFLRQG